MKDLLAFCQETIGFDNNSRLKAILFASGSKPNTYVHLKLTNNLQDKRRFEYLLRKYKVPFRVSAPNVFEEITSVNSQKAVWDIGGIWYGYDLFKNAESAELFDKAVKLIKKGKHAEGDLLLGKFYGYPSCCVNAFIAQHDPTSIAIKSTARTYYQRLHEMDQRFPYLTHTPCSMECSVSTTLNTIYGNTLERQAPAFFKAYNAKRTFHTSIVVDEENDMVPFTDANAHDYTVITLERVEGHHQLISWLSEAAHERGTVIDAHITLRHDYAIITPRGVIKKGTGFHHERHLPPPK